jgi:hypothetical protein
VRAYNPTARPLAASLRLWRPIRAVRLVNLNEDDLPEGEAAPHHLAIEGDQVVRLDVRGGEIVTLLLQF